MVKVRDDKPLTEEGQVDVRQWLNRLTAKVPNADTELLQKACDVSYIAEKECNASENAWSDGASSFETGLEMADILVDLQMDLEGLVAAILYRAVRERKLALSRVKEAFGAGVSQLIDGVLRMAAIGALQNPTRGTVLGQQSDQTQNIRKMLVAMVDDVRVAFIKLAERTCAIRAVKDADAAKKKRVAQEIFDIYAPLAHRLGIGHLKWELEDLSFRYLQPDAYKRIAALLDEKRIERDSYIQEVKETLEKALEEVGVEAQVSGRAKHIYSIWRKMQKKNIDFYQVYDIRAVRILVPTIAQCYQVLGLVHGLWQHIPKEFDDYIATPKENGYRSLHTAVMGSGSKILEVQIRTFDMHEEAELGVCAHWHYKEGTRGRRGGSYEDKITWLRQVLEWQEELGDEGVKELMAQIRQEVVEERIYVFTPDGHVVDMASGATPLDFAYHVHTEVGHRCRGAKVNGRIVPLNYTLHTGEQVEVLTANQGGPSRDWLNVNLGYIKTSRARAKVQHWFKVQGRGRSIIDGRAMLEREVQRLRISVPSWQKVAEQFSLAQADDLFAHIGAGDLKLGQVLNELQTLPEGRQKEYLSPMNVVRKTPVVHSRDIVDIEGVSNLVTHLAGCCKPVPGDGVAGYISVGKGVSVHREDCPEFILLKEHYPDRIMPVSWSEHTDLVYPVNVFIKAADRQGLLRDVSTTLANFKVNVINVNTRSDKMDNMAHMQLTIEVNSLDQLGEVLARLSQLPSVYEVDRGV